MIEKQLYIEKIIIKGINKQLQYCKNNKMHVIGSYNNSKTFSSEIIIGLN